MKKTPQTLPEFKAGALHSKTEFSPGFTRELYVSCTKKSFDSYVEALTEAGFELYGSNTLEKNEFRTFFGDELMVHVYYMDNLKTVSVLTAAKDVATPYPNTPTPDEKVIAPVMALTAPNYDANGDGEYDHNNAMGIVFTLSDGSYVIVDGGYGVDAAPLYDYLSANNKRADGVIYIRAWFISHSDGDHTGCIRKFAADYGDKVRLDYFGSQFIEALESMEEAKRNFAGCKQLTPLTGQKMFFGDLEVDFVFTGETLYPEYSSSDPNVYSLVMRVPFEGQTVLLMADAVGKALCSISNHYSDTLKCDVLQLPHHGLNGFPVLYTKWSPSTILFCTHAVAADERWNQGRYDNQSHLSFLKKMVDENGEPLVKKVIAADNGSFGFIPVIEGK